MTRTIGLLVALMVAGAGAAYAQQSSAEQTTPPPQSPPPTTPPTQTPAAAPAAPPADATLISTPLTDAELRRRRNAIDAMEGTLPTQVRAAAKETMREMEALQQTAINFLTSSIPRARGFHLDGYGVFFYVEIPGVRASVASAFDQIQRSRQQDRGTGAGASRAAESSAAGLPFDPNASYTDAVKRYLIDAMLHYSQPLDLRPNEWLTIAARDADEPIPTVIYESITMLLSARGSDLAEFRAGRLSREEMLKRVVVRGF